LNKVVYYAGVVIFTALVSTGTIHSHTLFDGIINAKAAWFILLAGLMFIFIIIDYRINIAVIELNSVDILISLLFIYFIINNCLHGRQLVSKNNVQNGGLLISYFFCKIFFSQKRFSFQPIKITMLLLSIVQIVIAILQWIEFFSSYNSNFKFTGFFFNPSPFAIYLSSLLIFCQVIYFFDKDKIIKTAAFANLLLGIPIIIISQSRSSWVGFILTSLLLFFLKFNLFIPIKNLSVYIRKNILYVVIFLLIIAFSSYGLYYMKKDSADGRLLTWNVSVLMFKDHLFLGLGQGGFEAYFLKYQSQYFKMHPEQMQKFGKLAGQTVYAFNDILQIAVEEGMLGLLLFASALYYFLKYTIILIKAILVDVLIEKEIVVMSFSIIIVIIISGFTSYPLTLLPFQVVFYPLIGVVSARYNLIENRVLMVISRKDTWLIRILGIAYLAIGFWYINYSIIVYHAYSQEFYTNKSSYSNELTLKLINFESVLKDDPAYVLSKCENLLKNRDYDAARQQLEKAKEISSDTRIYYALGNLYVDQKMFPKAEEEYKFLYYALPNLIKPKYKLAMLYYNTNQTAKWDKVAREIIEFKPKIPSIFSNDMQTEVYDLYFKKKR